MTEYYTKAVVLDRLPRGESDEAVVLYAKDLGKIVARVTGVKNINSKLSGHLNVGKLINARIVHKNNFKLVDAISEKGGGLNPELLKFIKFVNRMTPYEVQDLHLWSGIEYVLEKGLIGDEAIASKIYKRFLEIFGFGSRFARCNDCESERISYFSPEMLTFLCSKSLNKLSIDEFEVVKI